MDYHLRRLGIDTAGIGGYDNEEYTHMGVAVHVLSGGADVGLGVMSAARALNLDFVPLMEERYELCIPQALMDDHRIRVLLEVLATDRFKQAVEGPWRLRRLAHGPGARPAQAGVALCRPGP